MPKSKNLVDNVRYKFYGKNDHKTLKGHTIQMDISYLNSNNDIKKDHIILTQRDLVIAGLKKFSFFNTQK